jgi:conjugal transfer pilus assembly protein TraB
MSNNANSRVRQFALLGGAIVFFLGIGALVWKNVGNDPTPQAESGSISGKPDRVSIYSPGDVRDRDAWRTKAENDMKRLSAEVATSTAKSAAAEAVAKDAKTAQEKAERESLQARGELDAVKRQMGAFEKQGAQQAAANPQSSAANTKVDLNKGLPVGLNGSRVLNPPGTFALNANGKPVTDPSKQGTGDTKSTQPFKGREIEVAEFEPVERKTETDKSSNAIELTPARLNELGTSRNRSRAGRGTFIPASTFAKASQLYGIVAATGGQGSGQAGNPLPLVFEITDFANLPNLRKLNAKGCRVIAAATADLSSERVYPRLELLSCVMPNDEAVEMRVKGHVVGEDGELGIKGALVSKSGRIIAAQIAAAFAKGVGDGFKSFATTQTSGFGGVTQTIDPNRYGYAALGSGAAGGADALAQYYIKLSAQMFPVIEVNGGQIVEIVITEGVDFPRNLSQLDPSAFFKNRTGGVEHEIN